MLGTRALEGCLGTQALKTLGYLGTLAHEALGHSKSTWVHGYSKGTWTFRHPGTWALETLGAPYLVDS